MVLGAFKRLAEAFTLKVIVSRSLAVSLEFGYGTVVFTAVAEGTSRPEVFKCIGAASAQRDSVLDMPAACILTGLFGKHPFNQSVERIRVEAHQPTILSERFDVKPAAGLER